MTIKIHHLRPATGAKTAKTRVGRGGGSKGKTAGRGTKGTKARKNVPVTFEGGQMPIHMRLPKLKGFRNRFRTEYQVVNVGDLARLFPGRFVPACGHGVLDWMAQVGARAASPMTLLREWVTAVRALLAGETVSTRGQYIRLDEVTLDWPPQTVPPLLVGARGPKTVALGGELADGLVLDAGIDPDGVRRAV